MAKSARASSTKANNRRLKQNVFGPVEAARIERLSSKLMGLASQPKPPQPVPEAEMVDAEEEEEMEVEKDDAAAVEAKTDEMAMDVDGDKKPEVTTKKSSGVIRRRKVEKRRKPRNSIVFKSYKDRQTKKRKKN